MPVTNDRGWGWLAACKSNFSDVVMAPSVEALFMVQQRREREPEQLNWCPYEGTGIEACGTVCVVLEDRRFCGQYLATETQLVTGEGTGTKCRDMIVLKSIR